MSTSQRLRARLGEHARLATAMTACQSDDLVVRQLAMLAFANEIAHDVRNPLNAAKLQLQLLERRTRHLDEPLRESLEIVARELARLAQLLDGVLAFIHPLECAVHDGAMNASRGDMTPAHARTYLVDNRDRLRTRYFAELSRADEQQSLRETEPVEHATEQWDAHMLSALGAIDEQALRTIATALDRLEHGQFGLCACCGCQIPIARLDALPSATTCIRCASSAERP